MKRASVIALGLIVAALAVFGCASSPGGMGWTTLVDGDKGLDNWNRIGDANWRTEGGAIVADRGKGGFLVSKDSYKDFQIMPSSGPPAIPTAAFSCAWATRKMSARKTPTK